MMNFEIAFYALVGLCLIAVLMRITKQSLPGFISSVVGELKDAAGMRVNPGALNFWVLVVIVIVVAAYFTTDAVRNALAILTFAKSGVVEPKANVGLFVLCMLLLAVIAVVCTATLAWLDPDRKH